MRNTTPKREESEPEGGRNILNNFGFNKDLRGNSGVIRGISQEVTRVLEDREEAFNEDTLSHGQLKYFLFYGPPPEKVDGLQKYDLKDRQITFPNGDVIDLELSVIGASDIVEIKKGGKTLVTELFACTRVEGSIPEYAYLTQPVQVTTNKETGVYHRVFTLKSNEVISELIEMGAPISTRPNGEIDAFGAVQAYIIEKTSPHALFVFPIELKAFPYFAPSDITYPHSLGTTLVKAFGYVDRKGRNKIVTYSLHGYKGGQDAGNQYYKEKMSKEDTLVVTMTIFDLEKLENHHQRESSKIAA